MPSPAFNESENEFERLSTEAQLNLLERVLRRLGVSQLGRTEPRDTNLGCGKRM
jgi:hypothetical protein